LERCDEVVINIHGAKWELDLELEPGRHAISGYSTKRRVYEIHTSNASPSEMRIIFMRASRFEE